ncbi:uncharacterized protein At4g00950-like [Durio zibethinus]|uniref:Uncharacterized protein At4g00950-like n=1 Tax=Durio zibethinus TaxID=66656 RepID=A0A6P5ZYH9_DURZI|nr:uncharacterized protein At4g00950-like [Durio zibethinus]XP_022757566.1 uncharacterized protein At4g00950-like [Durio zibethinus]
MGSEAEKESSYKPKLLLFSASHAHMQSPERSGMLTPPLHASASVPFRWEEEPGKPKPCTTLTTFSNPNDFAQKCLELPPRLLQDAKITKLPSPTTVLEGPYMGRARFHSSSFRMGSECYGSFRAGSCSPEMVQFGTMVLSKRRYREKGFLGSWRRRAFKARREVGGNSHVFPSSGDRDSECCREGDESSSTSVRITRIRRNGSFPSLSHSKSHFWASIYEGLKQVVPWSKREKKDGFMG